MRTDEVSAAIKDVADRVIMTRFRALNAEDIIEKKPGDLVTVADREAESELASIFRSDDPNCVIVGEEGVFADAAVLDGYPQAEHSWVIDPIDGTKNFARGSEDFAVMVAETRAGETVRSWIWQPAHGVLYVAELGAGLMRDSQPVPARPARSGPARRQSTTHCCGVDYPRLAEGGHGDFLTYGWTHPWDHLPGALMVNEAGGRVATFDGREFRPGVRARGLLAVADGERWEGIQADLGR